jgi:hypothetical protein
MKNPCRDCALLGEDKNGPECLVCEKRVAYLLHIGHPVDMAVMIGCGGGGGKAPAVGAGYDAGAAEARTKICKGPLCRRIDPLGVERPASEYKLHPHTRDGLNYRCRKCDAWEYQQRKGLNGFAQRRRDAGELGTKDEGLTLRLYGRI